MKQIRHSFWALLLTSSVALFGQTPPPEGAGGAGSSDGPAEAAGRAEPRELETDVARGILAGDLNRDPEGAASSYLSVISQFDAMRPAAAQAIFRLAEQYRQQGRTEEAKALYARILREFPDHEGLARHSLPHLFAPEPPRVAARLQSVVRRGSGGDRQVELLKEEISLVEQRLEALQKHVEAGHTSPGELIDLQRERLRLLRELAALESRRDLVELPITTGGREPGLFGGGAYGSGASVHEGPALDARSVCLNNQRQIAGAVQQWALENKKKQDAAVVVEELSKYLRGGLPQCPEGGTYEFGKVGVEPICSKEEHLPEDILRERLVVLRQELSRISAYSQSRADRNSLVQEAVNQQEKELINIEAMIAALRNTPPTHLSGEAVDERYMVLKQLYEDAVLRGDAEGIERMAERMAIWVEKIRLPELDAKNRTAQEMLRRIMDQRSVSKAERDALLEEVSKVSGKIAKIERILEKVR